MLTDSHGPPVIPHLRLPRANYQPDPRRDHRAASALDPHAEAGPSLLNAPWPSPAPYASHPATSNPNAAALELQARSCLCAAVDRPLRSASATASCCRRTAAGPEPSPAASPFLYPAPRPGIPRRISTEPPRRRGSAAALLPRRIGPPQELRGEVRTLAGFCPFHFRHTSKPRRQTTVSNAALLHHTSPELSCPP